MLTDLSTTTDALAAANRDLADASPQEVLRWAVAQYHPRLLMATAFGAEGCAIMHMLAEIEPGVTLINLDTGYQFAETLELNQRFDAPSTSVRSCSLHFSLTWPRCG